MDYMMYMLAAGAVGAMVMAGCNMPTRQALQSSNGTLLNCLGWGLGSFASIVAEILVIWQLVW